MKYIAPFVAATSVRSDATFESVKIFKEEMEKYRNGLSDDDLQFVKNCALVGMLATMSKYGLPDDYIKNEETVINSITASDAKAIIDKYIIPDRMVYVVVGDAATQMQPLEKIGFGKPVLVKP